MATYKAPTPYKSQYGTQINNLTDTVVNRQPFSYDPNTDPAYRSYAKEYGRLGDRARQNTLGDYAANTGGYMSSYAVSAAQQAQNDYNQQLSNLIPGLMEAAYSRYKDDFNMNTAALSALTDLDNTAYSRWAGDRDFNRGVYESDRDYQYQQGRDKVADQQWKDEFGLEKKKFKWQTRQGSSGSGGGSGRSGGGGRRGGYGSGSGGNGGNDNGGNGGNGGDIKEYGYLGEKAFVRGLKAAGYSDAEINRRNLENSKKIAANARKTVASKAKKKK